jgi:sugar lactone lactonase YvrE
MLHSRPRFLLKLIGLAVLATCLLAQAQQPSGQAQSEGSTRQGEALAPYTGEGPGGGARVDPGRNLMANPYRMIENWPTLNPGMKWGAAINFLPDNKGGTWALLRTEPPINYFEASGKIVKSMAQGVFVQAHGMCRDRDGNLWAGDSGPFTDKAEAAGRGFQVFKFSPEGKLLLSLGNAGVSKAGPDTFVGPSACVELPDGDILIADGHWPRPKTAQQDGDRLVRYTRDGKFVRAYGKLGRGPGDFMGPHALALDSQGRIFVADRSNNRLQIFDKDMNYLDSWKHFGRPSGITILKDDTMIVGDSESGRLIDGSAMAPEGGGRVARNVGWRLGIRIGSAKDGSLKQFIDATNPEGMAGDEKGNIFAGLTNGCNVSKSGGCVQKWVKK